MAANPYYVSPSWAVADPQAAQGALTRKQWQLFQAKGRPLEQEVLSRITNLGFAGQNADEAGQLVAEAFDRSDDMARRRASRFGINPTAEQQEVLNRRRGLSRALAIAGAENTARRDADDTQLEMLASMMQIGRDISGQSSEGLNSAAQMANAREQTYRAQKAQHKQNLLSTALTGAGLAAAFFL